MPENETLDPDTRTASRWRPLKERLDSGESPSDMFAEIESEFYRALRSALKRWCNCGVNPQALFNAAVNDPGAFGELIEKTRFDDFAQRLKDVTARPDCNPEALIRGWLEAVWDCLQLDRNGSSPPSDFADRVERMIDRLSRGLLKDPPQIPPRPRRRADGKQRDIGHTLETSLL